MEKRFEDVGSSCLLSAEYYTAAGLADFAGSMTYFRTIESDLVWFRFVPQVSHPPRIKEPHIP